MNNLFILLLLTMAMAAASFFTGLIPLSIPFSSDKLLLLSTYSAGLLVGTALLIIIPEGVSTIYNSETVSIESTIGVSLIVGFAFMFLVENLPTATLGNTKIAVSELSELNESAPNMTTTVGLVVHSAADGIALGASSLSEEYSLEFIIFLAILLHKAPAAFGLTTLLLKQGFSNRSIRQQLLVFSLAAPITSILTYIILKAFDIKNHDMRTYYSGVLLLFSAGTFLYVATVHIIPEIYTKQHDVHERRLTWKQMVVFLLGMFSPMILSIGHHH